MLDGPLKMHIDIVDENHQSIDEIRHLLPSGGRHTVTSV